MKIFNFTQHLLKVVLKGVLNILGELLPVLLFAIFIIVSLVFIPESILGVIIGSILIITLILVISAFIDIKWCEFLEKENLK